MSAGSSVAAVIAAILGFAWLYIAISGSSEWGVGVFVAVLIMFFVSNRTSPSLRRHRRIVMRGDRLLRMNRKPQTR